LTLPLAGWPAWQPQLPDAAGAVPQQSAFADGSQQLTCAAGPQQPLASCSGGSF